jgi:phosphonate transport system substrate-binding protein
MLGVIAAFALAGGILLWQRTGSMKEAGAASGPEAAPAPPEKPSPPRARVRLAMSAAYVSESGVGVYEDLSGYLTRETGIQIEFVGSLAHGTINSMLKDGTMHAGFICGLPYVLLHDRPQPAAQAAAGPDPGQGGLPGA